MPSAVKPATRSSMRTCSRTEPAALELGGDERERLRARARAQDDVLDAELDEAAQQRGSGIGRGRRDAGAPRLAARSADGAALAAGVVVAVRRTRRRLGGGCAGWRCRWRRRPRPQGRRAGPARVVVLGVELGELLFEAADALVLVADGADAAEELGVVVGSAARGARSTWRTRPTASQRIPPSTGSSTTMSTQIGLLTPRWRVGGCTAQSTMVKTQKAVSHQRQNEQHPSHGSILGGSRRRGPVVTEPSPSHRESRRAPGDLGWTDESSLRPRLHGAAAAGVPRAVRHPDALPGLARATTGSPRSSPRSSA